MALIDGEQRKEATNPFASFIVQAPAGSGKTEILTQRYLRLLSTVSAPEQIIALTFTRKAASEMRERILISLQRAANNVGAQSAHQQITLDFAKEALARSEALQWNLLQLPNRLKIITIDSLCQSINQSIPLLEKQISYSTITDIPVSHYLNAGRHCIQYAMQTKEYQAAIKILLLHVDNRQDRLLALFKNLLAQRDQWLIPLFRAKAQDKSQFELALSLIEQHELTRFKTSLPSLLFEEMIRLAREVATIENNPASPRFILQHWYQLSQTDKDFTKALSQLLLTKEGQFRNAFDHHVGLKKGVCSNQEYDRLKSQSKALLEQLKDYPDFQNALLQVSQLPAPEYDLEQWEVLQALFLILPLLIGHLHLLFTENNEVDFTAISQFALMALGDSEQPTDLALYLDNVIHHLLVDEFQDTSITQFELLSQLVQGWQAGDGKTLFIVGDPMQSIYRFRQAEVGLFFRAKEQGIGPVSLKSLELCTNFRSNASIVNWVNTHFVNLFPKQVDIESGAVSFHPSLHIKEDERSCGVHAFQFKSRAQEGIHLIALIKHELETHPEQSLAILVRSRTHLAEIIPLLRQHQIPYQGSDIDLLANLPHLRDLWSLTQALLLPANRLAWLTVLRSPYCGLSLDDIHCIASFNTKQSIYSTLLQLDTIQALSEEGHMRAQFFIHIMHQALSQRYQQRLSDWVLQTLKLLHLDKILNQNQLNDLEQFWILLDKYEQDGNLPEINEFLREFKSLYSKQSTPSRLQVMTIHKSKGLEFDTVFLPGLGSQPNRGDSPMLRWLNLPTQNQGNLLLVSPIRGAHQESCDLYDYLSKLDEEKSAYEAQRVLYVAVTRAKSRLYLLDGSTKSSKGSFLNLLKHQLFATQAAINDTDEQLSSLPQIMKLPQAFYINQKDQPYLYRNAPTGKLKTDLPRLTGVITHTLLHWICDNHPGTLEQIPWKLAHDELNQLGFDKKTQQTAFETIQNNIIQLFTDSKGAWIIAKHANERNEYEILVEHQNKIVTRIIDRTFEEDGKLWIIDYKTGKEDETTKEQHQLQLNEYAHYLSSLSTLPIYCGLYYLSHGHWSEWAYRWTILANKGTSEPRASASGAV
jgi:ATP-dependent exoDNAse (exonuclease V) beta subunit